MEKVKKALDFLNIQYTQDIQRKLDIYMEGILEWNQKVNLTAITDRDEFIIKHYIDSILCADQKEFLDAKNVIDVGTGAGFPGIPLAIVFQSKNFVLMDSLNKRLKIIEELCSKAGINNITTIHARAEELAKNKLYREKYDICISRAVANLATLSEYCLPFIKKGGNFLAYKGPDAAEEIEVAKNAIDILGGKINRIHECELSEYGLKHNIVFINKIKNTPPKYPRKAGVPSKEPLK